MSGAINDMGVVRELTYLCAEDPRGEGGGVRVIAGEVPYPGTRPWPSRGPGRDVAPAKCVLFGMTSDFSFSKTILCVRWEKWGSKCGLGINEFCLNYKFGFVRRELSRMRNVLG